MVKTPCVGWNNSEPLTVCFPELTADYGDFNKLRSISRKLLKDQEYYNYIADAGREAYLKEYSLTVYRETMFEIFKKVLER